MGEVKIEDYLVGARNLYKFFGVKPRDHVLLLPTFEFLENDPLALQALNEIGRDIGAEVSMAVIEPCSLHGNPPRPIARAMESSDFFLAMGDKVQNPISGHCLAGLKARWDYGAKQGHLVGGKGALAKEYSKFPLEIILAIARSILTKLKKAKKIEIVDNRGTHLRLPYKHDDIYGLASALESGHLRPGERSTWPLGEMTILAGDSFSGVLMADCIRGISRILERPIRFRIENCQVADFEEREETRKLREEWEKPENSNYVDKLLIGLNPKASMSEGIRQPGFGELPRATGVTQVAIGDRPGYVSSFFYTAAYLLKPTMLLDGEMLFDHGRPSAFDEPVVREVAGRYGDPGELLTSVP